MNVEEYAYDFAGNRIAKIGEISTTYYLVDTNGALSQVLAEYDENGTLTTNYTRADELISQERSGAISYYLYDGSDSVRMLANEDGEITDTYTFDAFGNLTASTGSTKNDFLYRGEQYDSFTGLYYLRARYMNPATGTFITMDEYAGSVFEPLSLHKYLYANANPVMYSDPSGYEAADINKLVVGMACMTILAATILPNLNNITDWLGSLQNDLQPNWVIGYDDVLGWSEGLGRGTSTPLTIGQNIIISSIDDSTDNADEKDEPWKKDDHGQVYYHATSFENAILILESGTLKGSSAEGGYVYAWKNYPNKDALKASGARDYEVIIAFETQMAFENDPAFYNEDETMYYKKNDLNNIWMCQPVRSVTPGPIKVRIVGIFY